MQVFSRFAKSDFAKYPFLKAATKHAALPDLTIEDLGNPQYERILNRAEERIEEAVLYAFVTRNQKIDEDIEIISFPVAVMLALATQHEFIKKRYALAEANGASEELQREPREKILELARDFQWKATLNFSHEGLPHEFLVSFVDYLRNTTHLRGSEWKLVNRPLSNGNVYLSKDDVIRLLKEEIQKRVEKRLGIREHPVFPAKVTVTAERLKNLVSDKIGKSEIEGFPETVTENAFPPCVAALYRAFTTGRHLSHVGRFTLTSFLLSVGMPTGKVIELFHSVSDFDERMTRYQVEHIAGEKGSATRYIPPKCDTLKTHGVCLDPDQLCQRIRHPLAYYKRKV